MRQTTAHRAWSLMLVTALTIVLLLVPATIESSARPAWPAVLLIIGFWVIAAAASSTEIISHAARRLHWHRHR